MDFLIVILTSVTISVMITIGIITRCRFSDKIRTSMTPIPESLIEDVIKLSEIMAKIKPMSPSKSIHKWMEEVDRMVEEARSLLQPAESRSPNNNDNRQSSCDNSYRESLLSKIQREVKRLIEEGQRIMDTAEDIASVPDIGTGNTTKGQTASQISKEEKMEQETSEHEVGHIDDIPDIEVEDACGVPDTEEGNTIEEPSELKGKQIRPHAKEGSTVDESSGQASVHISSVLNTREGTSETKHMEPEHGNFIGTEKGLSFPSSSYVEVEATDGDRSSTTDSVLNQPASKSNPNRPLLMAHCASYDVYLSFRGSDIRRGFASHLYTRLVDAGIRVFSDDDEIHFGAEIAEKCLDAITHSKISIPILSKGYAASKWCLMEAVHMVKCKNTRNQSVLPIFYDVEPWEVRRQCMTYEDSFQRHSKQYDEKIVQDWRNALAEIGTLKGWELHNQYQKNEGQVVKEVLEYVLRVLEFLFVPEDCVKQVIKLLALRKDDVRIVGIYGTDESGATTLAGMVYRSIVKSFGCFSFAPNISKTSQQHHSLVRAQKNLFADLLSGDLPHEFASVDEGVEMLSERLQNKKVLILLLDVDHEKHLNALAASTNWFGPGSRVIFTTRESKVLNASQVTIAYAVGGLQFNYARTLFHRHASTKDSPYSAP